MRHPLDMHTFRMARPGRLAALVSILALFATATMAQVFDVVDESSGSELVDKQIDFQLTKPQAGQFPLLLVNPCDRGHYVGIEFLDSGFLELKQGPFYVPPGGAVSIDVRVQTADLEPGTYQQELRVRWFTAGQEPGCGAVDERIRVALNVLPDPGQDQDPVDTVPDFPDIDPPDTTDTGPDPPDDTDTIPDPSSCEEKLVLLGGLELQIVEMQDRLGEILKDALDAARRHGASVLQAKQKNADTVRAEALEWQVLDQLLDHDSKLADLVDQYEQAITKAIRDGDGDMATRLRDGQERSIGDAADRRRPMEKVLDARRLLSEEAADLDQIASQRRDRALEELKNQRQVLVDSLARVEKVKEQILDLLVGCSECFRCERLKVAAARLAGLRGDVERLLELLRQEVGRVQQARVDAAAAAVQPRDALKDHDRKIADKEQQLDDIAARVEQFFENRSIDGMGFSPAEGENHVGLLPGLDLDFHFSPERVDRVIEALKEPAFQQMRRDYERVSKELEALQTERPDKDHDDGSAQALVEGAQAHLADVEALQNDVARAVEELRLDQALEQLARIDQRCMQALGNCLGRIQDLHRLYHQERHSLGKKATQLRGLQHELAVLLQQIERFRNGVKGRWSPAVESVLAQHARNVEAALERVIRAREDALDPSQLPEYQTPTTVAECARLESYLRRIVGDVRWQIRQAEKAIDRGELDIRRIGSQAEDALDAAEQVREYYQKLADYQICLQKKRAALERLKRYWAQNDRGDAEFLEQMGDDLQQLSDQAQKLSDLSSVLENVERISDVAGELSDALGDFADQAGALGRVVEIGRILDGAFDETLSGAESFEVFAAYYNQVLFLVPDVPGVTQFLEFYGEVLDVVAGMLSQIEDDLVERMVAIGTHDEAYVNIAPVGIRDKVREAVEIRQALRDLGLDCGELPLPPVSPRPPR